MFYDIIILGAAAILRSLGDAHATEVQDMLLRGASQGEDPYHDYTPNRLLYIGSSKL